MPRAGGYFYSVPNDDLLSLSYDGSHFASSLEISVEDKIKRGKPPRIHLAVFLRGSRSSGRPSARSLLYCLHVLPLLRAIPAGCNTALLSLAAKMAAHSWLKIFLAFFRLRFDEENGQDLFLLPGITKAHRSRVNFACVL